MNEFGIVPDERELPERWNKVQRSCLMQEIEKRTINRKRIGLRSASLVAAALVAMTGGFAIANGIAKMNADKPSIEMDGHQLLLARSTAAATGKRDVIIHSVDTTHQVINGVEKTNKNEQWSDRNNSNNARSISYKSDGTIALDVGSVTTNGVTTGRVVDYTNKKVQESSGSEKPPTPLDFSTMKDQARFVGNETVNGVEAAHFTRVFNDGTSEGSIDTWLSVEEELPVRISHTYPNFNTITDIEWIERTDNTVADLLPKIPGGFAVERAEFFSPATTLVD